MGSTLLFPRGSIIYKSIYFSMLPYIVNKQNVNFIFRTTV